MSVIGPRPTLRYQVEKYSERQRKRLDVLPGITGSAQITAGRRSPGKSGSSSTSGRQAPLAAQDLLILLRTPLALFGETCKGETGGSR